MKANQASRSRTAATWGVVVLCGAIWGLGLARVLALELYWDLFRGWLGVAFCVVGGGALAALLAGFVQRRAVLGWPSALSFLPLLLPLLDVLNPEPAPWRGPVLLVGSVVTLAMAHASYQRPVVRSQEGREKGFQATGPAKRRARWLIAAAGLPLLIYLPDVSPYVGRADTFEFQVIGPTLGVAHPSGYPLYTLICKLFSLLPVGSVAWRVNTSSAILAALAAGFLFLALTEPREEHDAARTPLAAVVAWALAFSPSLWSRAIEAEVYALNACLVAMTLWVAVRWHNGSLSPARALPAFGLLLGLALAAHVTLGALGMLVIAGLVTPGLRLGRSEAVGRSKVYSQTHAADVRLRIGESRVRGQDRGRPAMGAVQTWALAVGLGVLGLALYAYIPLRWPAVTGGQRMSPAAFIRYVTNAGSGGALRPLAFYQDPARWSLVGRLMLEQVGVLGLVLAGLGVVRLARRHLALAVGSALAAAAWIWFGLSFYVAEPDYSAFLIPAHVVVAFWLGWGATGLLGLARRRSALVRHFVIALVALLPMSHLWEIGPGLDTISQGQNDEAWARYVLQLPLESNAAILADSEKFPPLYYLQQVEGLRADLEMVTLFSEAQYREALEARLAAGRRVYLARYLPGMYAFGVSSVGPLVALGPLPHADASVSGVGFGPEISLIDHVVEADPFGRPMHHVTLSWKAEQDVRQDLEVRFRLVERRTSAVAWEVSRGRPVGGYTTTQSWRMAWVTRDYHALRWPEWLPAGSYRLEVGLALRFGETELDVDGGPGAWYALGDVTLPEQTAPDHLTRHAISFGEGYHIVGSQFPGEAPTGSSVALDLAWVCTAREAGGTGEVREERSSPMAAEGGAGDPNLEVVWMELQQGSVVTQPLQSLISGQPGLPCDTAPASSTMRRYMLVAPTTPGEYRLAIRRTGMAAGEFLVWCGWLDRRQAACVLGKVTVAPQDEGLASYDGRILLLDAEVQTAEVPAGGPLRVRLVWRGLEVLGRDYTVFVQVVGPDGQVYGQADSWPVQGTRPTSRWAVGEEIEDPYSFFVDTTGPAGAYRVIVGWYLLEDMTRLTVVDSAGNPLGDFHEIGAFDLP